MSVKQPPRARAPGGHRAGAAGPLPAGAPPRRPPPRNSPCPCGCCFFQSRPIAGASRGIRDFYVRSQPAAGPPHALKNHSSAGVPAAAAGGGGGGDLQASLLAQTDVSPRPAPAAAAGPGREPGRWPGRVTRRASRPGTGPAGPAAARAALPGRRLSPVTGTDGRRSGRGRRPGPAGRGQSLIMMVRVRVAD